MLNGAAGMLGFMTMVLGGPAGGQQLQWPGARWREVAPSEVSMDELRLEEARDYALTGGGSGVITRQGKLVLSWGDLKKRYDLKSSSKSIGVTALGLAIGDGKIGLDDEVVRHHAGFGVPPEENRKTGWIDQITIRQLATQTAGFEKPGGYTKLVYAPGTKWLYSDGGPNWLAECVTLAYKRDVEELMFERVLGPIGVKREDLQWRKNAYRDEKIEGVMRREFGSGVHANVEAMARIGLLYLRGGTWDGKRILPAEFIEMARRPMEGVTGLEVVDGKEHGNASAHYGLLWWNNGDGTLAKAPRDAYWSWGLYDSLIVVIPSLDVVVTRAGQSWQREAGSGHYDVLRPFLEPIVLSIRETAKPGGGPEPSPVIAAVKWEDKSTIVRKAKGGDNWPMTWGDDGELYTAYGDGNGFEPFVERKLSMGFGRVRGGPEDFHGENLRTESGERTGDGANGPKVSGLLMVDGVLHALVRNCGNAQVAWSRDRGATWEWSDWKFEESFGYPTFLNFGRNYAGARDDYVYIYSHDAGSAYERADGMVLARVRREEVTKREGYEFFAGMTDGDPKWTREIEKRKHVFANAGKCYRSSVSYNAPLGRYLWCQTGLGADPRFAGGFAIYDAPEPWGPWTVVYETKKWDVGPGDTSCLPTKWMSADGKTMHLVFSGDDCFSVRRVEVVGAAVERD